MKKFVALARAFGAAFALVLLGMAAQANVATIWNNTTASVTGPWLGDSYINIGNLYTAVTQITGINFNPALSVSQTTTQAACTQLQRGFSEVKTSAATGSVCLPTAIAGTNVLIGNASGQTIDIFGSASTAISGTQDTINGTTGTTAYAGLTSGKNADCFAPANGAWYCTSGN